MHSKWTTRLLAIVAAAVLLWPLPQAFAQPDTAEPETKGKMLLKVWELPDPRATNPRILAELAVTEAFLEAHPNMDVASSIENAGRDRQVLTAIETGQAPDIMNLSLRHMEPFVNRGFLYPMDEYLKRYPDGVEERIPGPIGPVVRCKGPDGKHHWYALPHSIGARALMYRKDLFREVGLDPNRPPKTWEEMEEYAERLTRPEKGTYGLMFTMGPYASWDWMTFLLSAGGEVVVRDEDGQWRAAFDSDEAVEAALFYVKLNTREWTDAQGKTRHGYVYRETGGYQKWWQGDIGMMWADVSEGILAGTGDFNPDLIGLAPVPRGPTGLRSAELNASMLGIFSDIQPHDGYTAEEVRQAAFDYIWFYGSDEANLIRTKVLVEHGYGKFVNPAWLKKFGYEEELKLVPKEWEQLIDEAIKEGKPAPYGKNCHMVYEFMTIPLQECIDLERRGKLGKTYDERRTKIKEILEKAVGRANERILGVLEAPTALVGTWRYPNGTTITFLPDGTYTRSWAEEEKPGTWKHVEGRKFQIGEDTVTLSEDLKSFQNPNPKAKEQVIRKVMPSVPKKAP